MSVHVVEKANGNTHEVRWRTPAGAARTTRVESEEDASALDAAIRASLAHDRAIRAMQAIPPKWRRRAQEALR